MQTLESLNRKIGTMEELQEVVKTMKVIAAVNIRHYEKAVESLGDYSRAVEMGLQIVLRHKPEAVPVSKPHFDPRAAVIIFGSDQGMCGQFNEQIVSYALARLDKLQIKQADRFIIAIGARIIPRLEEAEQIVEEYFDLPGSVVGIAPKVQEIILKIETWRALGLERIIIFYNKPVSSSTLNPHWFVLMPLNPEWLRSLLQRAWPSRILPTFTMDWQRLLSVLIGQYFFVSLYRAFAESLASENASRLASMQGAESNIEDRLKELKVQFNQLRQSTITEELLDIVSGFTALTGSSAGKKD